MTTKPPESPTALIKLDELGDDAKLSGALFDFIDQLDPGQINRHLRDAFSNELAFLDVPEPIDFLDEDVVGESGAAQNWYDRANGQDHRRAIKKTGTQD